MGRPQHGVSLEESVSQEGKDDRKSGFGSRLGKMLRGVSVAAAFAVGVGCCADPPVVKDDRVFSVTPPVESGRVVDCIFDEGTRGLSAEDVLGGKRYHLARKLLPEAFVERHKFALRLIADASGERFGDTLVHLPFHHMENRSGELVWIAEAAGVDAPDAFRYLQDDVLLRSPESAVRIAEAAGGEAGEAFRLLPEQALRERTSETVDFVEKYGGVAVELLGNFGSDFLDVEERCGSELERIVDAVGSVYDADGRVCKALSRGLLEKDAEGLADLAERYGPLTPYLLGNFGDEVLRVEKEHRWKFGQVRKAAGKRADWAFKSITPELIGKYDPFFLVSIARLAEEASGGVFRYAEEGISDEKELAGALDIWRRNKELFGITHFHRYASTSILEENLKNADREHNSDRPLMVVTHNRDDAGAPDFLEAFRSEGYIGNIEKLSGSYKVLVYEADSDLKAFSSVKDAHERSGKRASVWLLGGHGSRISASMWDCDEYFSVSDVKGLEDCDSCFVDISDREMMEEAYSRYLEEDVVMVLPNCSNGSGRDTVESLCNEFGDVLDMGSVYCPSVPVYLDDMKVYCDGDGLLTGVRFDHRFPPGFGARTDVTYRIVRGEAVPGPDVSMLPGYARDLLEIFSEVQEMLDDD